MKKTIFIMILITVLISVSGYFLAQKYLLPQLILKLEKTLAQNTSYEFTIAKPEIKFLSITIPKVKITYQKKIISVNNIKIHPAVAALIHGKLKLRSRGNIHIEQEQFKFVVENLTYDIKNKTLLLLKAKIPVLRLKSCFKTAGYLKNTNIKDIKNIEGFCDVCLNIKPGKNKQLKLDAVVNGSGIGFSYQNKSIKFPVFTAQYNQDTGPRMLKASSENFYVLNSDTQEYLVKDGQFVLETDFKTAEIQNAQAIIKGTAWQGNLKADNIENNPDISFNLTSALCTASGEIKKTDKDVYFTSGLNSAGNNFRMEGKYNLNSQIFYITGSGNTDVKTLLPYINIAKDSVLNTLDADLKIADLKINYNKIENIISGYVDIGIGRLTINKHIFSDKGRLTASIQNNILELKNLTLTNGYGSIQTKGNIALEGKKPFQAEIYINNYELEELIRPFVEKDIGNALLSANCSIQGNIQEQNSILGACKWAFTHGNIGQLKFLSQVALLINKPALKEISFEEGKGTITFKNNTFNSPGSVLISPHLSMTVTGTMDTAGALDITLATELPQEESAAKDNSLFGKFGKILSAGMNFYKIKITGTVQEPEYTLIPATEKIFQKIFQ